MTDHDLGHETQIVSRPFDQVRPICSCGWLGTTSRNRADAEDEASAHIRRMLHD